MRNFLATYDLKDSPLDEHRAFLDAALDNGWYLWILGDDGNKYKLPNTTLDGSFPSYAAAWAALDLTARQAQLKIGRIIVEKWIIVEYSTAHFNSDRRLKA